VGKLYPIVNHEVLAGDHWNIETAALVRAITQIVPVMDDAYLDVRFFYVPARLAWPKWEEFCGVNKTGVGYPQNPPKTLPTYTIGALGKADKNKLWDYMGIPPPAIHSRR